MAPGASATDREDGKSQGLRLDPVGSGRGVRCWGTSQR